MQFFRPNSDIQVALMLRNQKITQKISRAGFFWIQKLNSGKCPALIKLNGDSRDV